MKIFSYHYFRMFLYAAAFVAVPVLALIQPWDLPRHPVVNDVTRLNPIVVERVVTPTTVEEIQKIVREHSGPISIGGGRYSMGGQTATENALQIDMRAFDKVLSLDEKNKTVTVQPGITWKNLQGYLDPYNLSVEIMQTYANFTVGGSLSVNVHGRYIGLGPIILSVKSIRIVLADGRIVEASPKENSDIFYGAIGGYGGIGVIVEATMSLADNVKIKRHVTRMSVQDYPDFFARMVRDDSTAVFHNGDIYPPGYDTVNAVTWKETDEPLTVTDHLKVVKRSYWLENLMYWLVSETGFGKEFRKNYFEPAWYDHDEVTWRNHEASYDVKELEPPSRMLSTYVLDEYFVPVENFSAFIPKMAEIFNKHHVKVLNISIRHAHPDPGSLLAWARKESFAFVVYYKQGTSDADKQEVAVWTREMADAVISEGGAWYLPYQPHASLQQFLQAYPRAPEFFALKGRLDPEYKFRNKLWDKYYFRSEDEKRAKIDAENYPHYKRPQEQTYLTLPEWYIVFSPDEYAQSLKSAAPSSFPYFSSIAQFWKVYHSVIRETWADYPVNWGYHAMICVIGTSYTFELAGKGVYENTIGRLTEWIAHRDALAENMTLEVYQQQVAQKYVDFIREKPWYAYPFYEDFKTYWALDDGVDTNVIRRLERRLFFSTELLFKAAYAGLIGLGTQAAYDPEELQIGAIVLENGKEKFVTIPRYEAFTKAVPEMIERGDRFIEIAGNKTILMTVVAPRTWRYRDGGHVMAEWPILTMPDKKRVAISLPVEMIHNVIPLLKGEGVFLDHIFDY
jgi:hypothetical protein